MNNRYSTRNALILPKTQMEGSPSYVPVFPLLVLQCSLVITLCLYKKTKYMKL